MYIRYYNVIEIIGNDESIQSVKDYLRSHPIIDESSRLTLEFTEEKNPEEIFQRKDAAGILFLKLLYDESNGNYLNKRSRKEIQRKIEKLSPCEKQDGIKLANDYQTLIEGCGCYECFDLCIDKWEIKRNAKGEKIAADNALSFITHGNTGYSIIMQLSKVFPQVTFELSWYDQWVSVWERRYLLELCTIIKNGQSWNYSVDEMHGMIINKDYSKIEEKIRKYQDLNYSITPNYCDFDNRLIMQGSDQHVKTVMEFVKGILDGDESEMFIDLNKIIEMPNGIFTIPDPAGELFLYLLFEESSKYEPKSFSVSQIINEIKRLSNCEKQKGINLALDYHSKIEKYGIYSLYDWCRENWGTRMNTYCYTNISDNEIGFGTNATPVLKLITILSEKFPQVVFEYIFYEWTYEGVFTGNKYQYYFCNGIMRETPYIDEISDEDELYEIIDFENYDDLIDMYYETA